MTSANFHASGTIQTIPIDRINVLNPRARNQKVFLNIAQNMKAVGLKRPITVTPCKSRTPGKDYDLICGQGRLEAFIASGLAEIPAMIIEASEEQALVMSLVENLARRRHRSSDILQGIEVLRSKGYDASAIAKKTGLSWQVADGMLRLMDKGEERLLAAVESGQMPIYLAIRVAENPADEQKALQEAYDSKQLRGNRLLTVKKLIDTRRQQGKMFKSGSRSRRSSEGRPVSVNDLVKIFQKEVDRKRLLTRKADIVATRLVFVTNALRTLMRDEHFVTLLRAEGLSTLPKPLAALMEKRG
ncbi:plasmid partitioning protein RepB C-terminal domain-containing protein [Asticcacaulis sp. AC460]|uniref:plasmid partitioning protein RepB C-terminal domain-containing protein n=1 Tax=Asticcacaulis sp. AC460 TaxID=1282360 RepID=UPI0004CED1CF|nr:plasmid partitioning protein RepB C-terminal domain-containing protein [Asticcacaulis sp. AC460]